MLLSSAIRRHGPGAHRLVLLAWTFCILCLVESAGVLWATRPLELGAYVVSTPSTAQTGWKLITAEDVIKGVSVPAQTNVRIQLPVLEKPIRRETLFGHRGREIRYWGFVYKHPGDPMPTSGYPGELFLSEAERAYRSKRTTEGKPTVTWTGSPRRRTVIALKTAPVAHKIDFFLSEDVLYLMTSEPLSLGLDDDGDDLNDIEEFLLGTDPALKDTDGDTLSDGFETTRYKTNPLSLDTDGDALRDDTEIVIHTDPFKKDTDGDGLCDGLCRVTADHKVCDSAGKCTVVRYGRSEGEDTNINGLFEPELKETDPRKISTYDDGIRDDQRVYLCQLNGGKDC